MKNSNSRTQFARCPVLRSVRAQKNTGRRYSPNDRPREPFSVNCPYARARPRLKAAGMTRVSDKFYTEKTYRKCDSREFIVGIKRFVLTFINYFRYKYSIIFSILSYATRRKLKNGRRLCDIFRKALENREDIEHKSPRP